jgi:tRNA A-37 threonylcarbamoyl transferase component Bud32
VHQCPTCGKHLEPTVRFCPEDGTPLAETGGASGQRTPTAAMVAPKSVLALPVTVGNRYKLTEARGGGGMAKVYRATDLTLEREVAVKLINPELRLDPEFDARFQREARIASQLSDPHIVVVHDFGIDPALGPFLVMEFLQGQTLRERLQKEGPLPLKACLQLCGQLFLALIHAHDKGIVHRDIKPDNLFLLNQSGVRLHMRVLDFGIARILKKDEAGQGMTLTHPGAVMGTPRYMSPEQLAGQPVDARSDLYSAALVMFESLTGQLPYTSGKKICELCPEAPPMFEELIGACLRPNPEERPASAIEVYIRLQELGKASGILMLPPGALDKLLEKRSAEATTVTHVPVVSKSAIRKRLLLGGVLGAVALLALLAGASILFGWYHWLFPSKDSPIPVRESLCAIQIGDDRDTVMANRKHAPDGDRFHGNPFKSKHAKTLGNVLKAEDVTGDPASLNDFDLLHWSKDGVFVLLHENQVRAVVVHESHAGVTARGVKVGDSEEILEHRYTERPHFDTFPMKGSERDASLFPAHGARVFSSSAPPKKKGDMPQWGKIVRYETLGIGFEVVENKVTTITLFPPKEQ